MSSLRPFSGFNSNVFDPKKYVANVTTPGSSSKMSTKAKTDSEVLKFRFMDQETGKMLSNPDNLNVVIDYLSELSGLNRHDDLLANLIQLRTIISGGTHTENPLCKSDSSESLAEESPGPSDAARVAPLSKRDFGRDRIGMGTSPFVKEPGSSSKAVTAYTVFEDDGDVLAETETDLFPLLDAPTADSFEEAPYLLWSNQEGKQYLSFLSDLGDIIHLEAESVDGISLTFKDPFESSFSDIYATVSPPTTVTLEVLAEKGSDPIAAYCKSVLSKLGSSSLPSAVRYWSDANGDYARILVNGPKVVDKTGDFGDRVPFYIDFVREDHPELGPVWVHDGYDNQGQSQTYIALIGSSSSPHPGITIIHNDEVGMRIANSAPTLATRQVVPVLVKKPEAMSELEKSALNVQEQMLMEIGGGRLKVDFSLVTPYDSKGFSFLYVKGDVNINGQKRSVDLVIYETDERFVVKLVPADWPVTSKEPSFLEIRSFPASTMQQGLLDQLAAKIAEMYGSNPKKKAEVLETIGIQPSQESSVLAGNLDFSRLKISPEGMAWDGARGANGQRAVKLTGEYEGRKIVFQVNVDNPKTSVIIEEYDSEGNYVSEKTVLDLTLANTIKAQLLSHQVTGIEDGYEMEGEKSVRYLSKEVTKSVAEWMGIEPISESYPKKMANTDSQITQLIQQKLGTTPKIEREEGVLTRIVISYPPAIAGASRPPLVIEQGNGLEAQDSVSFKFALALADTDAPVMSSPIRLTHLELAGRISEDVKAVSPTTNSLNPVAYLFCVRPEEIAHAQEVEFPNTGGVSFVPAGCSKDDFAGIGGTCMKCLTLKEGLTTAESQQVFFTDKKAYLVIQENGKFVFDLVIDNPTFCEALQMRYDEHQRGPVKESDL